MPTARQILCMGGYDAVAQCLNDDREVSKIYQSQLDPKAGLTSVGQRSILP